MVSAPDNTRPLEGIRVLEMGQLIAGPFASCMLGYFGAEVIKIEPPGRGDALRNWRVLKDGTSLWWQSMGRNKKCITLNLRKQEGRDIAGRLAEGADVLIENFRPGVMEEWGLSPAALKARNPGLIYTRVSGYGQTGPLATRPGFASVCEGFGGFRHINGFPGEAPVRPNLSIGDTLAALHAVIGILLALQQRAKPDGAGQVVDVAIYESVFNMLESVVPEYDGASMVRGPSGSTLTGIVPTNTYLCADGKYVIIGGNGDSIFQRLMRAADRDDLADDPRLSDNAGRVEHQEEVDGAISLWTAGLDSGDVLERLVAASVPSGPIYDVADMMGDPHYNARGMFETVQVGGDPLKIPALVPRLEDTPGKTQWPGPALGEHNEEILGGRLGYCRDEMQRLSDDGVI
ncbi:MAG: CaiB/BaiF CoA-transferase family protein [Gammaproteobacteria bacterium]|nr:CaiB/BaiF CoA-transferase family protein [Gammaproteobacteria bacterium]MDX2458973.1 CaiB/BaiF CoA-transferase family protein [Gammaproteobacteria bacterium]